MRQPRKGTYIREHLGAENYREDLGGVPWYDVPAPWRWHRCWAQSRVTIGHITTDKCPCGGYRHGAPYLFEPWTDRNTRGR